MAASASTGTSPSTSHRSTSSPLPSPPLRVEERVPGGRERRCPSMIEPLLFGNWYQALASSSLVAALMILNCSAWNSGSPRSPTLSSWTSTCRACPPLRRCHGWGARPCRRPADLADDGGRRRGHWPGDAAGIVEKVVRIPGGAHSASTGNGGKSFCSEQGQPRQGRVSSIGCNLNA